MKRKIEKIDLTALVSSQGPDIEMLYLSPQHPILVLSIYEILELRMYLPELYDARTQQLNPQNYPSKILIIGILKTGI